MMAREAQAGETEAEDAEAGETEGADGGRLEATVHGRVQGVGFRYHVARVAARLGIEGWVANQRDGSVAVVAEGRAGALEALEGALRSGPSGARVDRGPTPARTAPR